MLITPTMHNRQYNLEYLTTALDHDDMRYPVLLSTMGLSTHLAAALHNASKVMN